MISGMKHKDEIRKQMLALRQDLSPDQAAAACGYVCEKLLAIPLPSRSVIAGYRAIRGEVNITQALIGMHDRKVPLCLPTVSAPQRIMQFLAWRPKMALRKGAYGTFEPDGVEILVPTVLWVPLVAFDRRGYRLGYGGGYYDATITFLKKTNPSLRAIGAAYSFQEVEALPNQPHDVALDMVVTEKETIAIL